MKAVYGVYLVIALGLVVTVGSVYLNIQNDGGAMLDCMHGPDTDAAKCINEADAKMNAHVQVVKALTQPAPAEGK